ncbi:MAG: hypothetical protein K0S28_232 [Paucimonas sp.]|jgi:predicted glycoside hydrolase/deacetylase ChbG (UPF0249 family)|nr:hypothetical protein [Paucimonas sp.]
MSTTLQEKLGFNADDRLLILHADDIGMCEATVRSWRELLEFGLLTSASAMAPCSWFPAAAQLAIETGPHADLGLHLTLNCEWPNYRWSPLTGNDAATGMVDSTGYFHPLAKFTHQQVDAAAVKKELQAQITRAHAAGIDLTHFDSHMLTLWHPALMPIFIELAVEHRQPTMVVKRTAQEIADECVIPLHEAARVAGQLNRAAEEGKVIPIDTWHILPFGKALELEDRIAWVCERMDAMSPGVHSIIGHPAVDTPELRTIAPDIATRLVDHALFSSEEFRSEITRRGFKLIGFRGLRDLFQSSLAH